MASDGSSRRDPAQSVGDGARLLDERKAAILRAVVEGYIETAQPVGSGHVVRTASVGVSPATVRNEMVALERDGYLEQPHTSAGRIPTEKGYRFFVDTLQQPGSLARDQRHQVSEFFATAHGELERMLEDTTRLLASLTDYAAVVVGPQHEGATIKSVQLVGLTDKVALVVVVLSNGIVEKHRLDLPEECDEVLIAAATECLTETLVGHGIGGADEPVPTGDPRTDEMVRLAIEAVGPTQASEAEAVYVGGAARMASAFDGVETVREVLLILEQQLVVVSLIRDVIDRGLSVAIGTETGIKPLAECSLVVAPYSVEGGPAGTVGVLGPTRMNYPQAMAAVAVVSKRLESALGESG